MKSISFRTTTNSMSSEYAYYLTNFFSKGISSSPYWHYKVYGLALYNTNGFLIKTLTNVNVSSTTSGNSYYVIIEAQDTSSDSYTTDRAHVIATTPDNIQWSIFRAGSSASVTKSASDTLKVRYQIEFPISFGNTSGMMQAGFNAIYSDLTGQSTYGQVPISRFGIVLSNGTTQVLLGFTYSQTSGTDNNVPYYGIKYQVVDTSADAKSVTTIELGNDTNWIVCVAGGNWSKPANTTVTWWLEWRFRFGYVVSSSGIPGNY